MKRSWAVGILAVLAVLAAALLWAVPKGGTPAGDSETAAGLEREALTGSWEATVDLGDETSAVLRYTFCDDGTYTYRLTARGGSRSGEIETRGNYQAQGDRLYLSESLDYEVDPDVYDRCRLEGDELTLLENSANQMNGFYPLTLTRVAEE